MNRSIRIGNRRMRYPALRDALLGSKEFAQHGWARAEFGGEVVTLYGVTIGMRDDLAFYTVQDNGANWNAIRVRRANYSSTIVASERLWRRWREWRRLMIETVMRNATEADWRRLGQLWREWGLSRERLARHLDRMATATDAGDGACRAALEGYDAAGQAEGGN